MANLFESKPCNRCGGSGQYSYCQMHGTRCFGCGGRGEQLTKRGRAAQDFLNASRTVGRDAVKVGDMVIADDFFTGRYNAVMVAIIPDTWNVGQGRISYRLREKLKTSETRPPRNMDVGTLPSCTFTRVVTREEYKALCVAALAFQATLTKSGTPRKRTLTQTGAVDNA